MTIEQKKNTRQQFERLKARLDEHGIEYEFVAPSRLVFENKHGEVIVFPSQTYDDKLVVYYKVKEWCETAEDVLKACGLMED